MPTSRFLLAEALVVATLASAAAGQGVVDRGTSGRGAAGQATDAQSDSQIARGRYLVESVAVCWRCHTPLDPRGEPDRSRWLSGAPVVLASTVPAAAWAQVAPRLAGLPPGTDDEFITLMMTGISRTGRPPKPPMPRFAMTRGDAEAVLAYLKSLRGAAD